MSRRHRIAILTAVIAMLVALVPPLWVRATGDEVTLAIRPVDPLSLFRGNYVDLAYDVTLPPDVSPGEPRAVYVLFTDERPGRLIAITEERPDPADGEFCLHGKSDGRSLWFPDLEQFFLTPERADEIGNLADYLAVLRVTGGCRAVLVDLEPASLDG